LALLFMLAEVLGGWWSGSLALLADGGHMFSDAAALGMSWLAAWLGSRPGSRQQTFGYMRAEILAAAVNAALLLVVAAGIGWEAFHRLQHPPDVRVGTMAAIALAGLLVNLLMLRVLHGGHSENLNLRGAWLHVVGDTAGSVGVLVAAGLLHGGYAWADPAVSVAIGLLIAWSALRLLRDSAAILMEQAPATIDVDDVRDTLVSVPEVLGVHCLHVWTIASGFHAVSAHVVSGSAQPMSLLAELQSRLRARFDIDHVTLQIEPPDHPPCLEGAVESCLNLQASHEARHDHA
jgi:cobalt-zinc-cadmium efflux system protein